MPSTKTNLGTETRRVVVLGIVLVVLSITGAVLAVFYRGGPARQAKVNEAATPYEDIDSDEKLQQWDPDQPRKSKPRPLRHTARSAKDGSRKDRSAPAGPGVRSPCPTEEGIPEARAPAGEHKRSQDAGVYELGDASRRRSSGRRSPKPLSHEILSRRED
jgi:hypothetical protein